MPAGNKTAWLICYDIADPRRLRRVHRIVRQFAPPFQYSVFRKSATRREIVNLLNDLERVIDPRRDDLRAYPLRSAGWHLDAGKKLLPRGVFFMDE